MTNDLMLAAAGQLATITAATWGATEALGTGRPGRKPLIAVVVGLVAAVVAHAVGFLTALPDPTFRGSSYVAAAFAGAVCTVIAGLAHDKLVIPVLAWRQGTPVPAPTTTTVRTEVETTTAPTEMPPPKPTGGNAGRS